MLLDCDKRFKWSFKEPIVYGMNPVLTMQMWLHNTHFCECEISCAIPCMHQRLSASMNWWYYIMCLSERLCSVQICQTVTIYIAKGLNL